MAGHPGSSQADAGALGAYLRKKGLRVRQVQEFMPIPMTVSASMYHTGLDPFTGKPVAVSHKLSDARRQKESIMWWDGPGADGRARSFPKRNAADDAR
jgi:radical SAM superfamily enzyme YgiQ (UPF0313 family)